MAVKTFTTGEILTASDTNTYLNNGGLVYVTETSWTSQTGVNIDNCFTSVANNYRIVIDINALSANDTFAWQWRTGGSSGTTYGTFDYDFQLLESTGATTTSASTMGANYGRFTFAYATPGYVSATYDMLNPQAAFRVTWTGTGWSINGTTAVLSDTCSGSNRVTTAFTGIRLSTVGGTATFTGRCRIYAYRQA